MPSARAVALVSALAALAPLRPASAQAPDSVVDSTSALLQRAQRGNWLVRLTLPERQVAGRIRVIGDATIFFPRGEAPLDSIRRIERGRRVGDKGWVGAIVGGGLLGAMGIAASGFCEGDCSGAALYGATIGGAMGALIGFMLAEIAVPGRIEWRDVWP